jgi:hypothetical protein
MLFIYINMAHLHLWEHFNAFNDLPLVAKIGNQSVETYGYKNVHQRRVVVNVNPITAIATNILQGSQIDFRIESGIIDRISGTRVQLRVGYSNTSGGNCVISVPEAWLANLQVYSNNGSILIYQYTKEIESFIINSTTLSHNEHEVSATYRGTDSLYTTRTLTIANNASRYLYLTLAPLFWKSIHMQPYSIDGQLLVRLTFNSATNNISSGSMTIIEAVLRISGYEEPEAQKKLILSKAMIPKNFFYYSP